MCCCDRGFTRIDGVSIVVVAVRWLARKFEAFGVG